MEKGTSRQALDLSASAAGTYTLEFIAAQRGNYNFGGQTLEVLVDGTAVGSVTPPGPNYALYAITFAATAGPHTITIAGTNPLGGDNTALVDNVLLLTFTDSQFSDPDFDSVNVGDENWEYAPSGSPWVFSGTAGVSGNSSGITSGNPVPPQGNEVAFIQGTGSISQVLSLAAGSYTLSFSAAQRGNYNHGNQTLEVLVDGVVVDADIAPAGSDYGSYSTPAFTVAAGTHTITIEGTDLAGGDNTALVDNVSLQAANQLADPDFDAVDVSAEG